MSGADSAKGDILDLPLHRILVDPDLQPRKDGLDADYVAALQECLEVWPPIVAVDNGGFLLVDGFHRFAAAQNLGLETVRVEVREAPDDGDLPALAYALNVGHGRPLTTADRRAEAERLFRANPTMSPQEVARRAAISPTSAGKYHRELVRSGAIEATDQRVSRAGVAYRPAAPRQPGELPPDQEPLGSIFTSRERREQRRLTRYLDRLCIALDDQFAFENWERANDVAEAYRLVNGAEEAADLAERLGPAARNVLDVAVVLGYEDQA